MSIWTDESRRIIPCTRFGKWWTGHLRELDRIFPSRPCVRGVTPHVAEYDSGDNARKNSLRKEERRDPGFLLSQRKRKRVEEIFGWCKLNRMLQQVKLRGQRRID